MRWEAAATAPITRGPCFAREHDRSQDVYRVVFVPWWTAAEMFSARRISYLRESWSGQGKVRAVCRVRSNGVTRSRRLTIPTSASPIWTRCWLLSAVGGRLLPGDHEGGRGRCCPSLLSPSRCRSVSAVTKASGSSSARVRRAGRCEGSSPGLMWSQVTHARHMLSSSASHPHKPPKLEISYGAERGRCCLHVHVQW